MSQTPTISQPPEPLTSTPSRIPPAPAPEALAALEGTVRRLRAELAATADRARQARLLAEIADLEERSGDEPAAARDYLAAYNADSAFREPLEGLVRLLEKRRSLKNLGKLVDALARVATSPDEKVRALLMRAAYQADVANDVADAKGTARDATEVEGAPVAEQASAWLALEVLAGRTGDTAVARAGADAPRELRLRPDVARAAPARPRAHVARRPARSTPRSAWCSDARGPRLGGDVVGDGAARAAGRKSTPAPPGSDEARARAEVHADALEATRGAARGGHGRAARAATRSACPAGSAQPCAHGRRVAARGRGAAAARAARSGGRDARPRARARGGAPAPRKPRWPRRPSSTPASASPSRRATPRLARASPSDAWPREKDPGLAAALAMRIAEHAAVRGRRPARARGAVARHRERSRVPARARAAARHAGRRRGPGGVRRRSSSPSPSTWRPTRRAGGRSCSRPSCGPCAPSDVAGAKAALSQAAMYGIAAVDDGAPRARAREHRGRRRLVRGGDQAPARRGRRPRPRRCRSTWSSSGRGTPATTTTARRKRAARDGRRAPRGVARARARGLPPARGDDAEADPDAAVSSSGARSRAAVEELAGARDRSRSGARPVARRGDPRARRRRPGRGAQAPAGARRRATRADAIVTAFLADLDRAAGDHGGGGAGRGGRGGRDDRRRALGGAPPRGGVRALARGRSQGARSRSSRRRPPARPRRRRCALAWAARGVDVDTLEGRRRAIERAAAAGGPTARVLALERFATEVGGGDPDDAPSRRSPTIDAERPTGDLGAGRRRSRGSRGPARRGRRRRRRATPSSRSRRAARGAAARGRRAGAPRARGRATPRSVARAASRWFDAGGGLPAALEWLGGDARSSQQPERGEARAPRGRGRRWRARRARPMLASAALLEAAHPSRRCRRRSSSASRPRSRLANLELAPPGCDPRRRRAGARRARRRPRRATPRSTRRRLAGWSALAAADSEAARGARSRRPSRARPGDLAAWEGLRACGEQSRRHGPARPRRRASSAPAAATPRAAPRSGRRRRSVSLELGDDAERRRRARGQLRPRRQARRRLRQALPPGPRAQGQRQAARRSSRAASRSPTSRRRSRSSSGSRPACSARRATRTARSTRSST